MSVRVVVLGGINMDIVLQVPRIPMPVETVEGTAYETTPGGKGANQAVAAARALGEAGAVAMVGRVGADAYGRELVTGLDADGIDVTGVATDETASTGLALIHVATDAQNTVSAVYGANANCGDAELTALVRALPGAAVLLLQQEVPLALNERAMAAAREHGVTVVLDPAPARTLPEGYLAGVDVLTPNQTEAAALAGFEVDGLADAARAARAIRALGPRNVIVTLGELGAWLCSESEERHIPALPVAATSTLAAGDAFNGGLAAALAEGASIAEAAAFGARVAAVCVMRAGAQAAMPRRGEIPG